MITLIECTPTAGYIEKPCVVCGVSTPRACADCARDNKGRDAAPVHVCNRAVCLNTHGAAKHARCACGTYSKSTCESWPVCVHI